MSYYYILESIITTIFGFVILSKENPPKGNLKSALMSQLLSFQTGTLIFTDNFLPKKFVWRKIQNLKMYTMEQIYHWLVALN